MRRLSLLFVVLAAAACGRPAPPPAAPAVRPSVLLVTIDTLRADRVGVGLTPAIDAVAATGVRFLAARSTVPLTLPSHTTILTGLLPPAHGVRENGLDGLDVSHPTVATLLKDAGYQTAAFIGAFVLDRRFGLARGFDTYDDQIPRDPAAADRLEAERPATAVIDRALAWLNAPGHDGAASPFFVWIHLYDPHAPYQPPAEFVERAQRLRTSPPSPNLPVVPNPVLYDAEVAYADAQLGRVFDLLRARRLLDRTLIVVAGDHGEGLGDHGERTHGMLLYDSTLRVPLIIRAPGGRGEIRTGAVSLVDVAPTIAHAAGVAVPGGVQGHDLLGALPRTSEEAYAETEYPRVAGWSPLQALTDGRWMTIRGGRSAEIYDLQADAVEEHDLSLSQGGLVRRMSARMDAIRATSAQPRADRTLSAEAADRLRALGYVSGSSSAAPAGNAPNPAQTIGAWNEFEDALALLNLRRPGAFAALQRLAAAHPESMVFQATLARALKDQGQTARALAAYRDAVRRWPREATLFHDLAVAARDAASAASGRTTAGLRDEARRAEEAALVLAPADAAAHNGLGLLAADDDRTSDAVREFERATALDPNNASYWANLGNARRAGRERAGAEQAYRKALAADAGAVDALNGLGVMLVEEGRAGEAVTWFEQAIAASPDFVEARLNLGIALQQSGQTARAAEAYRGVLASRGPYAREKTAARKLLGSLEAR